MLFFRFFLVQCFGDHRDLHVLTHSFPTRRSSALNTKPRRRLLRRALLAALLLAVAGGGWLAYRATFAESATSAFVTAAFARGDIQATVLATGILQHSRLVAVGPQLYGTLPPFNVAPGDRVNAGDRVTEFHSVNRQNEL